MEREDEEYYELNFDNSYVQESSIKEESNDKQSSLHQHPNSYSANLDKKSKKILENDEISSLFSKKGNLQRFIETIGESSLQPIRNDILEHCEKLSIYIPISLSKDSLMKLVKNRVDKMIKNKRIKKNWSEEDIKILVWVISKYCQYHGISNIKDGMTDADWVNIADLIPGVSGKSCMFKWLGLKKNNLAENSWVEEESLLLDEMVKQYGEDNWCRVSEELFLKNPLQNKIYRCPKQCREHWNCYLNPQLKKGPWDKKEDFLLLRSVLELKGEKKWSEIVKMLNGRTENALKNRFSLIIEKEMREMKGRKKLSEMEIVENYLKKHDQYQIDESKLKFLSGKKESLIDKPLRTNKKKPAQRKKKDESIMSGEEEYIPEESNWKGERKLKIVSMKEVDEVPLSKISRVEGEMKIEKTEQFNPHSFLKNEEIFEDESQFLRQEKEIKSLEVTEVKINKENVGIEPNGVSFVPFSDKMISMLKNHTLIPCKITEANKITRLWN